MSQEIDPDSEFGESGLAAARQQGEDDAVLRAMQVTADPIPFRAGEWQGPQPESGNARPGVR